MMLSSMKRIAIPLAALGLLLAPAVARAASDKHAFSGVPVTGTTADGGAFSGTMDVLGFVNDAGTLKAIAAISGSTSGTRGPARQLSNVVALIPVEVPALQTAGFGGRALSTTAAQPGASSGCQVLDLVLGPLHLDLLGLVVDLNQVHLNITAQPGNGNLLGNLVCAVANLLNGSGGSGTGTAAASPTTPLVTTLATLLNNLLAIL
jgi:hypothetical protein